MEKKAVSTILIVLLLANIAFIASGDILIDAKRQNWGLNSAQFGDLGPTSNSNDEWPMFRHDLNHTGYSTSTAPSTNSTRWTYTTGPVDSSPAVVGDRVYVGSGDRNVYCLSASTGAKLWNYTVGGSVFSLWSAPAVADGRVYIGSDNGNVYCLNASTGAKLWNYSTSSLFVDSSPAVVGGRVYVGAWDGNVYCLSASTGAKLWNYTTGSAVDSSPAVVGDRVYVGSGDRNVYCLNATTGAWIWNYTTGSVVQSSPAVADGKVYVGSWDGNVYCLSASTGLKIWSYTTGNAVFSSPAVAGERVFIGSYDGNVYSFGLLKLTFTTTTGGTTNPSPGTYEYTSGTIVTVTAIELNYGFSYWMLDGSRVVPSPNPLEVTMNSDHTLQAVFVRYTPRRFPELLDDLYMVVCPTETVMLTRALLGEIDVAKDVENPNNVATVQSIGWTISQRSCFDSGHIFINCRDVAPSSSGQYYDYHGRLPGDSIFPLNIPQFRFALHLIIAPSKPAIIAGVFGWTKTSMNTFLSPVHGFSWINPPVYPPNPWATALQILNDAGFYNDTLHTGLPNGIWANTNPLIGPVGEIRAGFGGAFEKTIRVLGCPEAAVSMSLVSVMFMARWNAFFGSNSVGNPYFAYDYIPWTSMQKIVCGNRDFDICGMEIPLVGRCMQWPIEGRNPDYIYDVFHPDRDMEWGTNIAGINYTELNILLEQFKFTINYATGEIITDITVLQELCKEAQAYIFYLSPCIPLYFKNYVTATAFGVDFFINPLGYGFDNWWTYNYIMWENPHKTSMRIGIPGPIGTLNPFMASTDFEWEILSRLYDSLLAVDPFTKNDIRWAAKSYTMEEWSDPYINARGLKITFNLHPGITWHDGTQFTADDAMWSWDFINNTRPARYADVWQTYVRSEKINDLSVSVYVNNTGFWYLYAYAGTAMLFPETVWTPFWNDPTSAQAFRPWDINYDTWTGSSGHGDLTCLIGTGPYVFVEYSPIAQVARLKANRPFTIGSWNYTGRYWAYRFVRYDINFDGKVDITDISMTIAAYISKPGHIRWKDGQCDVNSDGKVDITDIILSIAYYGRKTLPPY